VRVLDVFKSDNSQLMAYRMPLHKFQHWLHAPQKEIKLVVRNL